MMSASTSTTAPSSSSSTNLLDPSQATTAGESSSQVPRRPIVRSRNGCLTCRQRRVKCDMGKPECDRCIKYAAQCVYPKKKQLLPPRSILPASSPTPPTSKPSSSSHIASSTTQATSSLPPAPSSMHRVNADPDSLNSILAQPSTPPIPDRPVSPTSLKTTPRNSGPLAWQTVLEALGPVDRLLAVCRSTRMGSFFIQPSAPPDFLRMFFPSSDDLQCFHHCVTYTLSIVVVSEDHNPWMESVAPLFMSNEDRPSGSEALKLSMLYLGAVHLSYLQGRDGDQATSNKTRSLALRYRNECVRILRRLAPIHAAVCNPTFLSAAALTLTADLLAANTRWRELMRLVKRSIDDVRGLDVILFPSSGDLVNPAMKCAVESLVILSQLAAFSSGEDYGLLSVSSGAHEQPPVWWSKLEAAEKRQFGLREFEAQCGISRSLILPFASLLSLVSHARSPSSSISPQDPKIGEREKEWYDWTLPPALDTRTQAGSLAIWQAGKILFMRVLRKLSRDDGRVQEAAESILKICVSVGDKVEYMNWPMIIACSTLVDPNSRNTARTQLKSFVAQCCYEIEVVQQLCEEMWVRMDEGEDDEACGWVEILIESGCPVLLG